MTATGAEAGENLVPVGPAQPAVDSADGGVIQAPTNGLQAEDARVEGGQAEGAAAPTARSGRRLSRGVIAAVLAVVVGCGAWVLLRHGVRTDAFPPFLAGTASTPITRYSGPWLTAAAGAALLAALLLMSAVFDIVRWSRSGAGSAA